MTKTGILLVGHGSKKEYNKNLITKTAEIIAQKNPDYIVRCGFMEFNEPTIRESLDSFKQDDVDSIAVVPLFLARGVHIDEDDWSARTINGGNAVMFEYMVIVRKDSPTILTNTLDWGVEKV